MKFGDPRNLRVVNLPLKAAAAELPEELTLKGASGERAEFTIEAEADGKTTKLPSFSMTAYNGGPFHPGGWYSEDPIVIDIAGMEISQSVPIDADHGMDIGHTQSVDKTPGNQKLKASGVLSAYDAGEQDESAVMARRIVRMGKNGFPHQASIMASVKRSKIEFAKAGEKIKANGRLFDGPVHVARESTLKKIAILSLGADSGTSTSIAAGANKDKAITMNEQLKAWLQSKNVDPATVGETALPIFQAAFDAEQKAKTPPPATITAALDADLKAAQEQLAAQTRRLTEAAAETERVNEITRICAAKPDLEIEVDKGGSKAKVNFRAHAIAEKWSGEKTTVQLELAVLRAERPAPQPFFGYTVSGRPAPTNDILEAAFCRTRNIPDMEKSFKPEVLEAADKHYRSMGLQQVILTAAAANGYPLTAGERIGNSNFTPIIRAAFGADRTLKAGFSSISLPGILGNVANKDILAGYLQEDHPWRMIAKVEPNVPNFYTRTHYRMLDDMEYEELGPGGEIKHGKADQESYTTQLKTYAKMFALTRQSIINDDLGVWDNLRSVIGRGAAKKFRKAFWTEFLSDASTFWTSARTNYITGATTTLLVDGVGLGLGVKAFRQMTSPSADGTKRVGGQPKFLLVPPELEAAARVLFTERGGQNIATAGNANPWSNLFTPLVAAELSDSAYTGFSTTAWYLLRDPMDMATVCVSFLNGMEAPTVEAADTEFNTLGIQFRGFHDFGVDQSEYLAGVKSKGAA